MKKSVGNFPTTVFNVSVYYHVGSYEAVFRLNFILFRPELTLKIFLTYVTFMAFKIVLGQSPFGKQKRKIERQNKEKDRVGREWEEGLKKHTCSFWFDQ
jgi:hypothetical protein